MNYLKDWYTRISSYPIDWVSRWKLRQIIKMYDGQTKTVMTTDAFGFIKTLEATAMMSKGMSKHERVTMNLERCEIESFIRYMTSLHDVKISRFNLARLGLATLLQADKHALGEHPAEIIKKELGRTVRRGEANTIVRRSLFKR
jgi:DNA integrity scanning protein DisA with diadenylate cyclase activity